MYDKYEQSDVSLENIFSPLSDDGTNHDHQFIKDTVNYLMPFGKYKGIPLLHLPEPYLVWFKNKGFPEGKLGRHLALMYEIKLNGLEQVLKPLLNNKNL